MHVDVVSRGDDAVDAIRDHRPQLVILDLMLPGLDGLEVCKRVRPAYRNPILMLTARGDELDEIIGLEVGADDYLAKPVKPRLLLARIRALLRRYNPGDDQARRIEIDGLVIDSSRRSAHLDGTEVIVTTAEFDLLWILVSRAGSTVTRETLHRELRGVEYDGLDRSIDLRVSRLRAKLKDDSHQPKRIKSVRGVGYIFAAG